MLKKYFLHLRPLCVMEDVFNNNNKHYFITRAFYTQKIINNVTPFTSHSCERFCVYLRCVFNTQKVIQLFMALFFSTTTSDNTLVSFHFLLPVTFIERGQWKNIFLMITFNQFLICQTPSNSNDKIFSHLFFLKSNQYWRII